MSGEDSKGNQSKPDAMPSGQPDTTPPAQPGATPPAKPDSTPPAQPDATPPAQPGATPPAKPDSTPPGKQAGGASAKPVTEEDALVLGEPPSPSPPPANPATFGQKVWLAIYLFACVVLLLPITWSLVDRLNALTLPEVSTDWEMPTGVTLNPGPAAFRYDAKQKKLVHYGPITAERKLELRTLFAPIGEAPAGAKLADAPAGAKPTVISGTNSETRPAKLAEAALSNIGASPVTTMETLRRSYNEAIDNLAYIANVRQGDVIGLLLVLGCLGGMLGAILRSLVDFVGNACYTQQLDLKRWWPLYFTRPLVGAILGFVLVVLFKAQLLTASNAQPSADTFWWLGLAVLGGFSTVDVTLRLRLAAKALFGVGDKKD